MKIQKTEQQLDVLLRRSEGSGLIDLWLATSYDHDERDIEAQIGFDERRDAFLWALKSFLLQGRIKLHKKGVFLESSIEAQVQAFRDAWPETDKPYPGHPDADFYLWFFDDACPAGVAWRLPDGNYQIAD